VASSVSGVSLFSDYYQRYPRRFSIFPQHHAHHYRQPIIANGSRIVGAMDAVQDDSGQLADISPDVLAAFLANVQDGFGDCDPVLLAA
jgi:hypothetical protein